MRKPLRMKRGPAQVGRAVPLLGIIRKGAQKIIDGKTGFEQMGPDLDHFRFVYNEEDEALGAFVSSLGEQPNHIRIMLPYPDVASNLQIANDCYKSKLLVHRCSVDDSMILTARDLKTYTRTIVNGADVKTGQPVYCNGDPIYSYTNKKGEQVPVHCAPVARFHVMLRNQNRFGTWTVLSGSNEDSYSLRGMLETLLGIIDNDPDPQRRKLGLQGIPMILHRGPRKVRYEENGKQHEVEKSLLWIEPEANWSGAAIGRMLTSSLSMAGAMVTLPNGDNEDEVLDLAAGSTIEDGDTGPNLEALSQYEAGTGEHLQIEPPAPQREVAYDTETLPTTGQALFNWHKQRGISVRDVNDILGMTPTAWVAQGGTFESAARTVAEHISKQKAPAA